MITFLTTAKPFVGDDRRRQLNAIRSWRSLSPDVEILLFGDGDGYEDVAREEHLTRIRDVPCSEEGCPRIDGMLSLAAQHARHATRAYVNCDIVLLPDLLTAAGRVHEAGIDSYLMVSQRWDMRCDGEIVFDDDWARRILRARDEEGHLKKVTAIDMFLYRGDLWEELPPLFVGRAYYDEYLIFYCRSRRVPVIDATCAVTLIHQAHEYKHVVGGMAHVWEGPEAQQNLRIAGGLHHMFTIADADRRLTSRGLVRNRARGDWRRHVAATSILYRNRETGTWSFAEECFGALCELHWRLCSWPDSKALILLKFPGWFLSQLARRHGGRGVSSVDSGASEEKRTG